MSDRPPDDLARAIAEASERVGDDQRAREAWTGAAPAPKGGRALVLMAVLAVIGAAGTLLPRHATPPPPRPEQEADLRWSVAAVVRQVEAYRHRHGRLPGQDELRPLLSDVVQYLPDGGHYQVVGQFGLARVSFDSRDGPAELWLPEADAPR